MDVQVILDAYEACQYVVNYVSKDERGVSAMLENTIKECVAQGKTMGQRMG
jgi:hypothetical protein